MKKYLKIVFILVFFLICAYPLYGLIWYVEPEVTENKVLASFPQLRDENGQWNVDYMSGLGDYFSDHFAGRQEMITANALINGKVFGSSSEDIIIVGDDGWLFYKDSLGDFQGTKRLTQRGLNNIVTSLSLIQEYVEGQGKTFLFTVAPNKNTLYPQYMPYYYPERDVENTLERLEPLLKEAGIAYASLKDMFLNDSGIWYHKGDSHWDNRGALMAQKLLLGAIGKDYADIPLDGGVAYDDFEGDLDKIFYPLARHRERDWDYSGYFDFEYVGSSDTTQAHIETVNPSKEGSLVMVRDSFGNTLVPFMAQEFGEAYFTKTIPYRVDEIEKRDADVYMIEIVERNLDQFQRKAPVIPAPERTVDGEVSQVSMSQASAQISVYDTYYKFAGMIAEEWTDEDSPVYLRVTSGSGASCIYEMFPANEGDTLEVTSDYGFAGYIPQSVLTEENYSAEILTRSDGQWVSSGVLLQF